MATPLHTPVESHLHAILDAADVVHRRLGPSWGRSVYLAVLEIVLADRGVATARCSLPIEQTGAGRTRRQEGLLCDRETWVHVAGDLLAATAVSPTLQAARFERAVLLQFTTTGVESRVLTRDGAAAEGAEPGSQTAAAAAAAGC